MRNGSALRPPSRRERAPARRSFVVPRGRPNPTPALLRWSAAVVLVSGCLGAATVHLRVAPTLDADAVAYEIRGSHVYALTVAESRSEKLSLQKMDGDMGVRIVEFDAWLRSLLRAPRLAWTLLALSTIVAAGCLHVAALSAEDTDD